MGIAIFILGFFSGSKFLIAGFIVSIIFVLCEKKLSFIKKLVVVFGGSVLFFIFGFLIGVYEALNVYSNPHHRPSQSNDVNYTQKKKNPSNHVYRPDYLIEKPYIVISGKKPIDSMVFIQAMFENDECRKMSSKKIRHDFSLNLNYYELHIPYNIKVDDNSCLLSLSGINIQAENKYSQNIGFSKLTILIGNNLLSGYQSTKPKIFLNNKSTITSKYCGSYFYSLMTCYFYVDGILFGEPYGPYNNDQSWFYDILINNDYMSNFNIKYDIYPGKYYRSAFIKKPFSRISRNVPLILPLSFYIDY